MQIDRSRFLTLTALIAGCGAGRDIRQVTVVDVPPEPTVVAIVDSGPPKPTAPTAESDYPSSEDNPQQALISEGGAVLMAKLAVLQSGPCGRPARIFNKAKKGCTDTIGKPLDCKAPKQSSGTSAEFATEKCISLGQSMLPGVARRAQTCIRKLGATPDNCEVYRCASDALMDACLTPKASAACKRLKVASPQCESYLSGLNDSGIQSVESCLKQHGNAPTNDDLYSCVESL